MRGNESGRLASFDVQSIMPDGSRLGTCESEGEIAGFGPARECLLQEKVFKVVPWPVDRVG